MKLIRTLCILIALSFLGGMLGFLLSQKGAPASAKSREAQPAAERATPYQPQSSRDQVPAAPVEVPGFNVPTGAIPGELVLQFNSRDDYEALLQALADAGLSPLGRIDQLWAVRLPQSALGRIDLGRYDAGRGFSYRITQPPPPTQIAPEVLATLRAFGQSARFITGGPLAGDGQGVRVAVLDSGVQAHAQFDDIEILELDIAEGSASGPGAAHGTSVASIITGREGIAPGVELISVRVLDGEGVGNSFQVAEGIIEAVDRGAQIINMSLGVYENVALLRQAVRYAHDQGVIMVAAAGNDGYEGMPFPAAYSEVLAVTAVDASGQQARFPNQSAEIDFAAPGVGIRAAGADAETVLFSGTSAAAPFVTGSLASLMSGDHPATPDAAVRLLSSYLNEQGAPGADPVYGAGVLDWDRLRERSRSDVIDVALADIYLPANALPGTNSAVEVTVQNRGTQWLSTADLEILVGEEELVQFRLGSLSPGQSTTRQVFVSIPSRESSADLNLAARVKHEDSHLDIRLENNVKAVTFRPSF
jgi:hypothetical protein